MGLTVRPKLRGLPRAGVLVSLRRHDRSGETATCMRCLKAKDADELDRLRWCEACCTLTRARAGRWGWLAGGAVSGLLALWIWVWVQPALLLGVWLAILVSAFWLSSRIAREMVYGGVRFQNRGAAEAVPPLASPENPDGQAAREG